MAPTPAFKTGAAAADILKPETSLPTDRRRAEDADLLPPATTAFRLYDVFDGGAKASAEDREYAAATSTNRAARFLF